VRTLLESKKEATLGVEERVATMFFSDIEGFTSIAERVPPSELILCLEEYFNAMTRIIEASGGTVGDFIGDAVFAFWGAPVSVGQMHALLAVRAAWAQQVRWGGGLVVDCVVPDNVLERRWSWWRCASSGAVVDCPSCECEWVRALAAVEWVE
jgi:class 3 adenylate cyclase